MKYNYHPLEGAPAVACEPTALLYQASRYADHVARTASRNLYLMRPVTSRVQESVYREYFRRAHAEIVRKCQGLG